MFRMGVLDSIFIPDDIRSGVNKIVSPNGFLTHDHLHGSIVRRSTYVVTESLDEKWSYFALLKLSIPFFNPFYAFVCLIL